MDKIILKISVWLTVLCISMPLMAKYSVVETRKVPIQRLIDNLEKMAKETPENTAVCLSLGRLYAMAYAIKANRVEVTTGDSAIWYGYEPDNVPHNDVTPPKNEVELKRAYKHIKEALKWYKKAIKLDPDNLVVQLGYGWCLEQAGKKKDAKKVYRKVADASYTRESTEKVPVRFDKRSLSAEAHRYLIAMLDPNRDKKEIDRLQQRLKYIKDNTDYWITPIAIPLADDLSISALLDDSKAVSFNLDGQGGEQYWSWISPQAAWLVYDGDNDGDIRSGRDLFGNSTFWLFWENGYEALQALDDDGDAMLRGKELEGLALWQDANANGISDAGEVLPLKEWGIHALSCDYQTINFAGQTMWQSSNGVVYEDGRVRNSYDLLLQRQTPVVADEPFLAD